MRPAHVPACWCLAGLTGGDIDALEDAAILGGMRRRALGTQGTELLLEAPQFLNPMRDVPDVLVEQGIHFAAIVLRSVLEPQQHADFIERHVQVPALPDETQALHVRLCVDPVVAFGAPGRRNQFLALVEADGLDGSSTGLRQFADSHVRARKEVRA